MTGNSSRVSPFPGRGDGRGVTAKNESKLKLAAVPASRADTGTELGVGADLERGKERTATPDAHS